MYVRFMFIYPQRNERNRNFDFLLDDVPKRVSPRPPPPTGIAR